MGRHSCFLLPLLLLSACAQLNDLGAASQNDSTILVSSVGRPRFSFEVYMASIANPKQKDQRLTLGTSVNYNGQFVADSETQILKLAVNVSGRPSICGTDPSTRCKMLVYVSEDEQGAPKLYFNTLNLDTPENGHIEAGMKLVDIELITTSCPHDSCSCASPHPFFQDRPSIANGTIFFVGMRKPCRLRQSWTAIFSTRLLRSGEYEEPQCLTIPTDVADFSPSVSPSGKWVIVASDQDHGFQGQLCTVGSDLYIFRAENGSDRRLLIKNGGWPSWGSTDSKFFFHRIATDGWWSVYEASIMWSSGVPIATMEEEKRLTLPGFHAFTPAASKDE